MYLFSSDGIYQSQDFLFLSNIRFRHAYNAFFAIEMDAIGHSEIYYPIELSDREYIDANSPLNIKV